MVLILQSTNMAARSLNRVQTDSGVFQRARIAFEQVARDIRNADACLAQYPPTGDPAFVAGELSTLILRRPVFDGDGKAIPNTYDVVIYSFEHDSSANGPQVLKRYTASIDSGTAGDAVFDSLLGKNLTGQSFICIASESFTANQDQSTFGLTNQAIGSTESFFEQVLIGGRNALDLGRATLSSNQVIFNQGLKGAVPIDVIYHIDPSLATTPEGTNNAKQVHFSMTVRPNWRTVSQEVRSRNLVLSSRIELLNH